MDTRRARPYGPKVPHDPDGPVVVALSDLHVADAKSREVLLGRRASTDEDWLLDWQAPADPAGGGGVIAGLLRPATPLATTPVTAAAEAFEDVPDEPLHPEEEAVIARAVDKRRAEFRTVRACARQALADLGVARPPLVPGSRGAPTWPAGIVGSMTHCSGYRAAAVARANHVLSLGIDAEPGVPLPDGLLSTIALPEEVAHLAALALDTPGTAWDRLLFSAKESVYKTWYPLTQRWLGFEEVLVTFDPGGTFTAALVGPGPMVAGRRLTCFPGRWTACRGHVLTAVVLPVAAPD